MEKQTKRRGIPFFRKLLFFLVVLIIFAAIGLWYANEYILPAKGKALVIDYLTKSTGRRVTLESIYFNPFRGIALKNLTISDDPKYQRTFLKIERLYFNVLYLPIFQEKKIIIPLISVDSPKFILTIDNENKWNFESLEFLKPREVAPPKAASSQVVPPATTTTETAPQQPLQQAPSPQAPLPSQAPQFKVYIYKVAFSDATCTFEDRAISPMFTKELKNLDFQASVSYPLKIKYRLNSELATKQKNSIAAKGEFDPIKKQATLNLQLKDIPLADFQPYYVGLPFKSLSGNLSGDADLTYSTTDAFKISTASTITNLNLTADDYTAKGVVDVKGKVDFNPKDKTTLKYTANVLLKETLLNLQLKNMALGDFKNLSGKINGNLDLAYSKDSFAIKTSSNLAGLNLTGEKFSAKSDIDVNAQASLNPNDKTTLKYNGDALLKDAVVRGMPTFDVVEKINGKLFFNETKLWADSIKGTSRSLDFTLAGTLKDYTNPFLALTAKTTVNLAKLSEFLTAEQKEKLKDYEIGGVSQMTLSISGLLKGKTPLDYTLISFLSNCNVSAKFLPKPITSINGTLISKANSATLKDFSGIYDDKKYALNGDITNFKTPQFNLALLSEDLNLKTNFVLQEALATLSKFEGKYKNIKFNLFGAVSDFKDPLLNVYGSIALDINELKNYLPQKNVELLTKNEVSGELSAKFYFAGKWKDQKTWAMELKVGSPQLQVKKLKFDDCYLEYKFKDNFVSMPTIAARPYGGNLVANVAIDYAQKNPQYAIELDIKDVDISKWKNDTELKKYDLRGLFYANAEFGGFGNNIETLRGKGRFAIVNGKLWELPVFAGLANILFIPGVDKIVFREARGSFTVGNKAIYTSDTEIHATEMNLVYDGSVDFDGNLDFSVTAAFAKNLLATPTGLGPLRDLLLDQAGNYIGDIKLKGTLKEPKYAIKPFPIDKIFQKKLLDKFKGIFEGASE